MREEDWGFGGDAFRALQEVKRPNRVSGRRE